MEIITRILVLYASLVLSGCAFGAGGGIGVSMDTRGTVSLLASANVKPCSRPRAADDDGWLTDFTLSVQYLYITYFTIGL